MAPYQKQSEQILVTLSEDHRIIKISDLNISAKTRKTIDQVIQAARDAAAISLAKKAQKIASQRELQSVIIALLENPTGLDAGAVLSASESISLISLLGRLRGYLKTNNLYTLKKKRINKQIIYYLDPIR